MPDSNTVVEWLAAAAFAAAACWFLYSGLTHLLLDPPQRTWTPVRGRIQISGVDEVSDGDGGTNYTAVIEYLYEYKGTRFIGSRVTTLQWPTTRRFAARNLTGRYPPGREVMVFVNPRNPGDAVLEPGRQVFDAVCHCLVGIALALGAFLFVGHG